MQRQKYMTRARVGVDSSRVGRLTRMFNTLPRRPRDFPVLLGTTKRRLPKESPSVSPGDSRGSHGRDTPCRTSASAATSPVPPTVTIPIAQHFRTGPMAFSDRRSKASFDRFSEGRIRTVPQSIPSCAFANGSLGQRFETWIARLVQTS